MNFKNKVKCAHSRWWRSKMWRSPSSRQIHQKYICMWNNSYRTPTECWQKTSDFPKGKKIPTYLESWGKPTRRGGAKINGEPHELCEQRREREISPCSLRSSGLNLHNQLELCGCQGLGALAWCQASASEVGGQVQDIAPPETSRPQVISIGESSPRDLHLNTKTQFQPMASKLQC